MKISKLFLISLIVFNLIIVTSSCSTNDDNTTKTSELSEEEAVELIESSLKKSTGGLNDNTKTFAESLTTDITINEDCSVIYNDTFVINYDESVVQASYTVDWSYEMTCNNIGISQSVEFSSSTDGNYSSQRIISNDNSTSYFEITGLQPTANSMVLNGDYERNGMQELTIVNTRSVISNLTVDLTDIIIDKSSSSITSGTATLTLSGSSKNKSFSFEGSLVFNDDETATLIINENTYVINLG
ncbi:hypothetical protein [Psychroserpens ponticola]|uniref:Auto-transporter adhesin head GIN domain-containing protein n=1 Tax=Psychroserpens ponticola TaxID=2932268 RepID=A0ABY7S1B9_9FLAO|nr:hypothetical protein [Psychroserpens ponticola]WCO02795.1 hypothetical protein MUN68_004695 [Psychroserpens ponticola]